MLGISAKRRLSANGILRTFFSHAEQHPHVWGLATFPDGGAPIIDKEPVCASRSAFLKSRLDEPIEERTLIAHIRFATVGHLEYANCHPFSAADNRGRIWTLAHNGTIFNGPELNDYIGIQYGDTDSERVLLHLIDRIDREQIRLGRALDEEERFGMLAAVIAELSKGNKLNLLIYDGEILYAHCNFRGTLHVRREADAVTFSTRPLSGEGWEEAPFTSLIAVKDGEIIRTSPPHGNEYIHNPNDYRMVYMDFARL
jgi:glutamine amidotransferase